MKTQQFVEVSKAHSHLIEGEELKDFIDRVVNSVAKLEAGGKRLALTGIYKDHVITKDFSTGQFFRHKLARKGEDIELSTPQLVRQVFEVVGKSDGTIEKSDDSPEYFEVKEKGLWSGVL